MDLRLPVLLVTLLYAATAGGSGPRDYYLPHTPARKGLYESCMNKGGCVDRLTDFLKGTCYLFCFFDQNDDGFLTTEEGFDVWSHIVGRGKAVPHSVCVNVITKATGNFSPAAYQELRCDLTEHMTEHPKGVMTMSDVNEIADIGTANGTVPMDLERFIAFQESIDEATLGNP